MNKRLSLTSLLVLMALTVVSAATPGPPRDLTAHVTGNVVTLFWQNPSTGGEPVDYIVEASLSPAGPAIATLRSDQEAIVVRDVPDGVYYVRVRASNADGVSAASNEVIVVVPGGTPGCSSPPTAPTNLSGNVSGNFVSLAWTASAGGCPATDYAVQAGSAPGLSDVTVVNVGGSTTLSASAPSGTYYVRVVALNSFGGSPASNEIVLTVSASCQAPTVGPTLSQPTVSGNVVTFEWSASGGDVTSYILEAGSASGAKDLLNTMTAATTYTANAPPGAFAYVRVRAVNACGGGPASNEVVVNVPAQ